METVALVRWDSVEEEAMVAADLSSKEKGGWLEQQVVERKRERGEVNLHGSHRATCNEP